jgi:hypothetical protein
VDIAFRLAFFLVLRYARYMRINHWSAIIGLLVTVSAAFSQTDQRSLGEIARTARKPASQSKVITNEDLPPGKAQAGDSKSTPPKTPQTSSEQDAKTLEQFESQGKLLQDQARQQKTKLAEIEEHIRDLENRLAEWNAEYWTTGPTLGPDGMYNYGPKVSAKGAICATPQRNTPYYKHWCNTPQSLDAESSAARIELAREKLSLEKLQDGIRRKGYGIQVYDPD